MYVYRLNLLPLAAKKSANINIVIHIKSYITMNSDLFDCDILSFCFQCQYKYIVAVMKMNKA